MVADYYPLVQRLKDNNLFSPGFRKGGSQREIDHQILRQATEIVKGLDESNAIAREFLQMCRQVSSEHPGIAGPGHVNANSGSSSNELILIAQSAVLDPIAEEDSKTEVDSKEAPPPSWFSCNTRKCKN